MGLKINRVTGKLDETGMTATEKGAYLKIDQTTQQSVINDAPIFTKGLIISSGEKLIFDGGV